MDKGQYQFTFDLDGDISDPKVVASKAHEHGPKEKQADLLDHAHELEQLRAWNNEGEK